VTALLADGNLLIALTVEHHIDHDRALTWFETVEPDLATCPITKACCCAS
jgi:predicted nucleic acid-binding protein